jgi:hypothetical protein
MFAADLPIVESSYLPPGTAYMVDLGALGFSADGTQLLVSSTRVGCRLSAAIAWVNASGAGSSEGKLDDPSEHV